MSTTKYIINNQEGFLSGQTIIGDLNVNGSLNSISGITITGDSKVIGNLSATTFYGDGSNLTGINSNTNQIDIVYNELYDLLIASGLTEGATYRLTDYKSVNFVNGWLNADNNQASTVAYAGLLDGSFQNKAAFNDYVTTMDFQRSGSLFFDGNSFDSQTLVLNNGEFIIGNNDFTIEWYQYLSAGTSSFPISFSMGILPSPEIAFLSNDQYGLTVNVYQPTDGTYEYPADESQMDYLFANSLFAYSFNSTSLNGISISSNDYALDIIGTIIIPSTDTYYFGLDSDDGSDAFIDGIKVADWYGSHGNQGSPNGNFYPITLSAGSHSIRVRMQQRSGGDVVYLYYGYDGINWNIIPDFFLNNEKNYQFAWNGTLYPVILNTSPLNKWSHFAITRQSGIVKIFQDGNKVFEQILNDDLESISNLSIGNETNPSSTGVFRGHITNFRYISGTSIYNSNFTPSEKPLYATDETVLLLSIKDHNDLNQNNVYGQNLIITNSSNVYTPTVPFSEYDIYVGGGFITYDYFASPYFVKLKANGSVDESFYSGGQNNGFDGEINAIKVLSDGKVLVGGTFYNYSGETHQFLVKLNTDGTLDPNFSTTTIPNYVDGYVRDIYIEDKTGNIFIGGSFLTVNNLQRQRLAKLDKNGYLIDAFEANINGEVFSIEMIDNDLYVGGSFSIVQGNGTNCIVKLNSTTGAVTNTPVGSGFNGPVTRIKKDNVERLICVGSFTAFDGSDAFKIMRLNNTLTPNYYFAGNNSFLDDPYTLDVDYLENIIVGGDFTSYSGIARTRIIRLLDDGTVDLPFEVIGGADSAVYYLSIAPNNRILLGGNFNNLGSTYNGHIARIMGDDQSPVYNCFDVHIGDEEVLYLKAISNNKFEKIVYSEKYKNDIIEYSPYVNVLGNYQEYYTGNVLNDGTQIYNFNLRWDSQNNQVYFDMPPTNPVYFGHFLYFYADFYNNYDTYYSSFTSEPILPGFNKPEYQNTDEDSNFKSTNVVVSSGGTRLILTDLTYDDYLNYNTDSLYVETIYKVEDSYGYITRRNDTARNIDIPLDFRNIKYRRYEMNFVPVNSNLQLDYYGWKDYLSLFFGDETFNVSTTGKYNDFYLLENKYDSDSISPNNIYVNVIGGPDGGYWNAGSFDNNVFLGFNSDNRFSGRIYENTFMQGCYGNTFETSILAHNIMGSNFNTNQILGRVGMYDNIFGYGFERNIVKNSYFINNNLYGPNNNNTTVGFFGYNTINSYFDFNNINYSFQSNNINSYFRYNDIKYNFYSNLIANNFEKNIILSEFESSQIGAAFTNNIVNNSVNNISTNNAVSKLIINTSILNQSFNSSTYIYGDYSKEILKSTDGSSYIGFLSGTSKVYMSPITS